MTSKLVMELKGRQVRMTTLDVIDKGAQYELYFSCYEHPSRMPISECL